jgi:Flp pilus assembly protein TadG
MPIGAQEHKQKELTANSRSQTGAAAAANERFKMLRRFGNDNSGSYTILTAIMMPVLIGFAALGTDYGTWLYAHQTEQAAADSGALSAAVAYVMGATNESLAVEAEAITSSYGFTNGADGVTVTVNSPPKSGTHTATLGAVEVIIGKPSARYFSALFGSDPVQVVARAVATPNDNGLGCVLALNKSASGATTLQGSTSVTLNGCRSFANSDSTTAYVVGGSAQISALSVGVVGNISGESHITATQGISTGDAPQADPYASASYPAYGGCDKHNFSAKSTITLDPGVYCGGLSLNAGANVTLNPGVYYLDQGSLQVNGGATLTGNGVTLVFTSSSGNNYATASINGGATVNLTAPTSGPTAGIAIFGDRDMSVGTSFKFNGGASQTINGAIYVPRGAVNFAGGAATANANTCTQLVADTITFVGNSNFALNCSGSGIKPIASSLAKLVE